jgi:hypothetical protein
MSQNGALLNPAMRHWLTCFTGPDLEAIGGKGGNVSRETTMTTD